MQVSLGRLMGPTGSRSYGSSRGSQWVDGGERWAHEVGSREFIEPLGARLGPS